MKLLFALGCVFWALSLAFGGPLGLVILPPPLPIEDDDDEEDDHD
jgi:hypothetical protein